MRQPTAILIVLVTLTSIAHAQTPPTTGPQTLTSSIETIQTSVCTQALRKSLCTREFDPLVTSAKEIDTMQQMGRTLAQSGGMVQAHYHLREALELTQELNRRLGILMLKYRSPET